MLKRILIANRGEIAVRVIRTCKEMGIESVAVFSDADRFSPHVILADMAFPIGLPVSSESYLNMDKILDVAIKLKADGIHPGYGFLSENTEFAEKISGKKLRWIGPPPKAMKILGDKVSARNLARKLSIPLVPGSNDPISTVSEAVKDSKSIGYPVLVKAAGGGGGKGMRIINSSDEMKNAFKRAVSESKSSFRDGTVFIEKYIPEARHIEIQVLADSFGNVVVFTERECSIQRRYQKIIEESPSPLIDRSLWEKMADDASKLIQKASYTGAGTVEFIVDENKQYYFLEVNTRLQVEHPVTEMLTGIDFVKEQIKIACNENISITQKKMTPRGHSIECRIYAEDGFLNFIPSTGKIHELHIPDGLGIRFDGGVIVGQPVTPYYDPLLGKLITWGNNRNEALNRMKRALTECRIAGVDTTVPFCLSVLNHSQFEKGNYNTHFIQEKMKTLLINPEQSNDWEKNIASVTAALHKDRVMEDHSKNHRKKVRLSSWKHTGREEELR
tara:strand:+ start:3810 stop:5315 length:1506 start_codon:yes stop_codon:yes gene_type:complete